MRADASASAQLAAFIGKFEPRNQRLIRAVRSRLRKRFASANELVYDNYNFFVIGYSPTERPSDAVLSIAAGANGVSLCFVHGARLNDPKGLLSGGGKQTRFLRVATAADIGRPDVESLLRQAESRSRVPFVPAGRGKLIIRSISAKQRPRRPS